MSKIISIKCDVCGGAKKEVNHWWTGRLDGEGLTIRPVGDVSLMFDLCSEKCVMTATQRYLATGKITE